MISLLWRCAATLLSITGALGVSSRTAFVRMIGFGVWIVGNAIWFVNAITVRDLPQAFLWTAFTFLAARGAINNYYDLHERR